MSSIEENKKSQAGLVTSLEASLETPAEKKKRLISLFLTHFSMLLSGFGNSIIYIGMYPYIVAVSAVISHISHLISYLLPLSSWIPT